MLTPARCFSFFTFCSCSCPFHGDCQDVAATKAVEAAKQAVIKAEQQLQKLEQAVAAAAQGLAKAKEAAEAAAALVADAADKVERFVLGHCVPCQAASFISSALSTRRASKEVTKAQLNEQQALSRLQDAKSLAAREEQEEKAIEAEIADLKAKIEAMQAAGALASLAGLLPGAGKAVGIGVTALTGVGADLMESQVRRPGATRSAPCAVSDVVWSGRFAAQAPERQTQGGVQERA